MKTAVAARAYGFGLNYWSSISLLLFSLVPLWLYSEDNPNPPTGPIICINSALLISFLFANLAVYLDFLFPLLLSSVPI